jgi:hypothetical protein
MEYLRLIHEGSREEAGRKVEGHWEVEGDRPASIGIAELYPIYLEASALIIFVLYLLHIMPCTPTINSMF